MQTYVGLLRAVNVGGRKLAMTDLRAVAESCGGREVRTYLQSGNVVFSAGAKAASSLSAALSDFCGFEVPVLLRKQTDLAAVVSGQPGEGPSTAWHVTFLERAPAAGAVAAIDPTAYEPDTFTVVGREVYLRVPDGYGRSKLTNALWERKLGVVATTRNWRTVCALAEL